LSNTVYGPFSAISITNGVTPANKTWGDNAQTQASVAMHGINSDLSGPFVLSGITCTKDGTIANQLDIASGTAYLTMSDGTIGKIAVGADNTHTTSTISTTYYLFLKNDGTWQWSTTSTGPTNSIPICQATTDGSGNISAVTDVRHNAGSPGVPILISQSLAQSVTSTTDQIIPAGGILAPVRGLYRFTLHFTYRNATPQKVVAFARYTDPTLSTTATPYFILLGPSSNAGQILNGSQASATGNNQSCACAPIDAYCEAGGFLDIHFQDGGGTPNDVVSTTIARIG
jgi:hypothetical protein